MEIVALFIWPAIAFGVIGYLGWSTLRSTRRSTALLEQQLLAEAALKSATMDYEELLARMMAMEKILVKSRANDGGPLFIDPTEFMDEIKAEIVKSRRSTRFVVRRGLGGARVVKAPQHRPIHAAE